MYNENIKKMFIDEQKKNNIRNERILKYNFERTKEYEERYGKDLCDWTTTEIITFYKMLFSTSTDYLNIINSLFSRYSIFCIRNNIVNDAQNHFSEIDLEILNGCVCKALTENNIISRENLLKALNNVSNASDKYILLGIFEGIYGDKTKDLFYLKTTDINGNTVKLHSGKEIVVSDELIECAKESARTYEYFSIKENADNLRPKVLIGTPYTIIKDTENCTYSEDQLTDRRIYTRIYHRFQNAKTELGLPDLNMKDLIESGRIEFIKSHMTENDTVESVIKKYKDEISNRFGTIHNVKLYLIKYGEELNG